MTKTIKKDKIQPMLKKGISTTTIPSVKNTSNTTLLEAKKNLLKKATINNEVLTKLTTQGNFNKLKKYIDYTIYFKDDENNTIWKKYTKGDIERIIHTIKNHLIGQQIGEEHYADKYRGRGFIAKENYYFPTGESQWMKSGTINDAAIQMTMRVR